MIHINIDMWKPKLPKFKMPALLVLPKQTGPFPAREWRAHVALIASIFGAIAFTAFALFMVYVIWKGGWAEDTAITRIDILGQTLIISLSGALVVLISLGFAINRRTVKIGKDGLEASGGGDDDDDDDDKHRRFGGRRDYDRGRDRRRDYDDYDRDYDRDYRQGSYDDAETEEDRTSVFEPEPDVPRRRR